MIKVDVGSFKAVIKAMDTVRASEHKAAVAAVREAGAVFYKAVNANGSLQDGHDPSWFAAHDHPYARRHGSIRWRVLGHKGWYVHSQTGQMASAIKGQQHSNGLGYRVFVDTTVAPHARHVVQGTRVMLGRDFIWLTSQDRPTRREIMRAAVKQLGKMFRTKARIRFGSR